MLKIGKIWGKIANYPPKCSTEIGTHALLAKLLRKLNKNMPAFKRVWNFSVNGLAKATSQFYFFLKTHRILLNGIKLE